MRVLIADDSDMLVERLVAALLEVNGVQIVGRAWTGAGAMETIWRLKPDVVILDLCMPGGSGIGVLESIKKNGFDPTIIVLTNYAEPQYRKKCLRSGARFFFDKSAEFDKVTDAMRILIAQDRVPGNREQVLEVATFSTDGPRGPQQTVPDNYKLIVSRPTQGETTHYLCSHCLRGFALPDVKPEKQAVEELYRTFRDHLEQDHPESVAVRAKSASARLDNPT